jgi:quinol monooxygenase YgiN
MFIVANRVPVASGWEETFEERFRQRAGQIDKQPGFMRMQILKPQTDDTPYVVLPTWQDKTSLFIPYLARLAAQHSISECETLADKVCAATTTQDVLAILQLPTDRHAPFSSS